MDEIEKKLWLERVTKLEEELSNLKGRPKDPIAKIIGWVEKMIKFVGIPTAIIAAFIQFDQSILNRDEFKRLNDEVMALQKIERMEDINSDVYTLLAQEKNDVVAAQLEAKKGRIDRLTEDIYKYWEMYPDMYGYYEKVTVIAALNQKSENDKAIAVLNSIDPSTLNEVERIDHLVLIARTYFTKGPELNVEKARENLVLAVKKAQALSSDSQSFSMYEKILSVRIINELYYQTECSKVKPLYDTLESDLRSLPADVGLYASNRALSDDAVRLYRDICEAPE